MKDDLHFLRLLDQYSPLLTATQREITDLYFNYDLSLGEIAEEKGVSRQSVSDCLQKCRKQLEKYEEKLTALPSLQFEDYVREIFSNTVDIQTDAQGRIVIPQFLKEKTNIQKNVLFIGVGNHIEIWAQEAYEDKRKSLDMNEIKKLMIDMGF